MRNFARLSRRDLLGGLAVLGVATACRPATTVGQGTPPPAPDPLAADLADERRLQAAYDATLERHPSLQPRLGPLRDNHEAHVAALTELVPESSPEPSPSPAAVPADPKTAVRALRSLEQAAATARSQAAVRASGERAALLGSMAAGAATHTVVLG